MHKITFNIEPVPASRPRVTRWATYYSEKYETFRNSMAKLLSGTKKTLYEEALKLDVTFYFTIPKSWSKKKAEEFDGKVRASTPDLDNLEKALYDSMNGHIYLDDSQIVEHRVRKFWVKENGRIEVIIERL